MAPAWDAAALETRREMVAAAAMTFWVLGSILAIRIRKPKKEENTEKS
jgi:hypothetical protein